MRIEQLFERGMVEAAVLLGHLDEKLLETGHTAGNLDWRRWLGWLFVPRIDLKEHRYRWRSAARETLAAIPCVDDSRDLRLGVGRNLAIGLHRHEDDLLAVEPILALVVDGRRRVPGIVGHDFTSASAGNCGS